MSNTTTLKKNRVNERVREEGFYASFGGEDQPEVAPPGATPHTGFPLANVAKRTISGFVQTDGQT
jgi:hypothetical protein